MTSLQPRTALSLSCAIALLLSSPARAEVFQTDAARTPLPQPVTEAEVKLSSELGWRSDVAIHRDFDGSNVYPSKLYSDYFPSFVTGDAVRLSGLFKWRGEQIDEVADARIAPGYFSPSCGFTGELVLHGGNCTLAFGWYNVDDPENPTPPAPNEIYELIPSNIETYMQCMTQNGDIQPEGTGFCPFGWDNHHPYNLSQLAWVPRTFDSGEIASDPRYKGGLVAFALIGNPASQCSQTKHSIAAHNDRNASGEPWITTLIWQSTVDPEGFYVAFEDLKMSPEDWHNPGGGALGKNDGDFNDFVYYITGLSCQGGGQPCDTGLQGACSIGRTDCVSDDGIAPNCRAIIQPGAELCDNVDNDCNGFVDDGEGLCPPGQACDQGVCKPSCANGEFACDAGRVCEGSVCVFAECVGVVCPAGQACRGGECKDPCTGVTCPGEEECQLGRCVNPCAGVTCPEGRVCERGLCVSNCRCRPCPDGLQCGADGRCGDPLCAGVTCEGGLVCKLGQCVDLCADVVCPGGAACINGSCADPESTDVGTGGSGPIVIGVTGGAGSGGADGAGSASMNKGKGTADTGCGCRTASPNAAGGLSLLLGVVLGGAGALRRGSRRKKAQRPRG